MTVALTGATGLLGANLAVALREAGHAVRATRRATSKTAHLDHLGLDWVEADLRDPESLVRAFDGVDAVFHCAAAVSLRRELTPLMQAVNIDGTDHVIEACRAAGTGRLVHCSSTVTVGVSTDGRPCTEASPWNLPELGIDDGYSRSKRASEQRVLAAAAAGLDAVVVNPGFMFGPLDQGPSSGELLLSVVTGQVPALTPGGNSFVDVRSVARGMVAAWQRGRPGERYILAGHNLPYADAVPRFCAVAGVRPPRLRVPFALAALPAALGSAWERLTDRDAKLNLNALRWSYTPGFAFSSEKAERELGYEAGPLEPALVDALRWWQSQGMLGALPALPGD